MGTPKKIIVYCGRLVTLANVKEDIIVHMRRISFDWLLSADNYCPKSVVHILNLLNGNHERIQVKTGVKQ